MTDGTGARCACGATYDHAEWEALPFVGVTVIPADDEEPEDVLEMRNCGCGSTITGPITVDDEVIAIARAEAKKDWHGGEGVYQRLSSVAARRAAGEG